MYHVESHHRRRRSSRRSTLWVAGAIVCFAAVAHGQAVAWRVEGGIRADFLGTRVLWIDDLDGDAVRDFAVSATGYFPLRPATGRIELRSGADGSLIRVIASSAAGDSFGLALASLDDLDGDGFSELLVGAMGRVRSGSPGTYAAVDVISPATGALLRTDYDARISSSQGFQLARLDDVDGDGVADYVASTADTEVRSGASGSVLRRHLTNFFAGLQSLVALDDVDADGVGDYAIGDPEPNWPGFEEIDVHSGASGALLHRIDRSTFNDSQFSFGWSLASAGDLDGDGAGDFVGGGAQLTGSGPYDGAVFAISGGAGTLLWRVDGATGLGESLGFAVAVGGDTDGDGDRDVLTSCAATGLETLDLATGARGGRIATPRAATVFAHDVDVTGDGRNELLLGAPNDVAPDQLAGSGWFGLFDPIAATTLHEESGESWASRLGAASIVIEDRDGDGWRDLAVGVPGGDGDARGLVRVTSGRDGSELARHVSPTPFDDFGAALAAVADLDGDGVLDWLVASPAAAGGGQVQLVSGANGALLWSIAPPAGAARFGTTVAAAADASGRWIAAIGDPTAKSAGLAVGRVDLVDVTNRLAIGARAGSTTTPNLGIAVAAIGDTSGDGIPEFAIGGNFVQASVHYGYLELLDGATATALWSRDGTLGNGQLGRSISAIGDLDGDAIPDFVTGYRSAIQVPGVVSARSGSDGRRLWEYSDSSGGSNSTTNYGETIRAIGDVDGDGRSDLLVGAPVHSASFGSSSALLRGVIDLRSGSTGARLKRWYGPLGDYSCHGANLPSGGTDVDFDLDGDGLPELIGGGDNSRLTGGQPRRYYLEMRPLTRTLLELDPPSVAPNGFATASVRGGPPGAVAGILLVDFAAAPVNQFLAIGTLDSASSLSISDTIPPGLTGLTATLRGYAFGYGGKLQASDDEVLTFD